MKVGGTRGSGPYHIQAEINMIPLIDVALVLLIIFMVISPILVQSQLSVNLPKVTISSQADENPLKVEIASDGTIAFKGKIMSRDELRAALTAAIPPGSHTAVLIEADKDVPFDNVVFTMDLAKQLKVDKLGVSVLPTMGR